MAKQSKSLGLYYRIQHVLGECAVDGHTCDYDSGGSDKDREKKAAALILADKQAYALEMLTEAKHNIRTAISGNWNTQPESMIQTLYAQKLADEAIDQAIQKINQDLEDLGREV